MYIEGKTHIKKPVVPAVEYYPRYPIRELVQLTDVEGEGDEVITLVSPLDMPIL